MKTPPRAAHRCRNRSFVLRVAALVVVNATFLAACGKSAVPSPVHSDSGASSAGLASTISHSGGPSGTNVPSTRSAASVTTDSDASASIPSSLVGDWAIVGSGVTGHGAANEYSFTADGKVIHTLTNDLFNSQCSGTVSVAGDTLRFHFTSANCQGGDAVKWSVRGSLLTLGGDRYTKSGAPLLAADCATGSWSLEDAGSWYEEDPMSVWDRSATGTVTVQAHDGATRTVELRPDGTGSDKFDARLLGYGDDHRLYEIYESGNISFRYSISGSTLRYSSVSGAISVMLALDGSHGSPKQASLSKLDPENIDCSAEEMTYKDTGSNVLFVRNQG